MDQRPKRTDNEDDILEMQKKFLAEKVKNSNFQPAAKVIKVDKGKKQSIFAKTRNIKESSSQESKPSELTNIILGDIVEKIKPHSPTEDVHMLEEPTSVELGFPKVERLKIKDNAGGRSLFALSMERKRQQENTVQENEISAKSLKESFGEKSVIVEDDETAKFIHEENLELISKLSKEAIMEERAKLLKSMDPNLIQFLTAKRQKPKQEQSTSFQPKLETCLENTSNSNVMEVDEIKETPVEEILIKSESEKWIHFDVIEKEKLQWMKDVPQKLSQLKPGEKFEARFDWKGVLLPFTNETDFQKDNRELYLHGDEPNRPGYTLQELFRLARSNIIQQRISAFGSITGILNIYNQGFYDNVLELPISKIFFLLRFGFDENTSGVLEVVSKAFSVLFYNDTDETILDLIAETNEGYLQPIMEIFNNEERSPKDDADGIEASLKNLTLTSSPFMATVQENEEESKTSMNDFQLAETDLIECLLRTNIIQRISYILGTIRPENSTVSSCLKILIRIARTNKDSALKILENNELIRILFNEFLPGLHQIGNKNESSFYGFPQHLVLKLFRILICQQLSLCIKLLSYNLLDHLRNYLFTREDMKSKLIKVQIESLRIVRVLILIKPDYSLYRELLPAFRYMLEWHYQNIIYEQGGPFLIRQHAAALLCAICSGPVSNDMKSILAEALHICCCKWFYEATRNGIQEFSQSILLTSTLNTAAWYLNNNDKQFNEFIEKYLRQFIQSEAFYNFLGNLNQSSILLKTATNRSNIYSPLLNLGTILHHENSPQIIIPQTYPVFFLNSLFKIIEKLLQQNDIILVNNLLSIKVVQNILGYLKELSYRISKNLRTNFLVKNEIHFVYKLLCLKNIREHLSKEVLLQVTYNILKCMTSEHIEVIEVLFNVVIFNGENLDFNQEVLKTWKEIYLETFVYPHRIIISPTEISLSMPSSRAAILPFDWPYVLLKSLLNKYLQQMSPSDGNIVMKDSDFPEDEIIHITLSFTALLERNGLEIASPTEKLMYLMIAFMGPDCKFLEKEMKTLLKNHISKFFHRYKDYKFEFYGTFEGKSKFENLYILFLDHFQAASYGDDLFSSLVLIPLAQKYDIKWRKMIWSEHASVLRFLNCDENQLMGTMDAYLNPIETDVSLIKCYAQALNSNLLRENTIPYRIAMNHVSNHKKNLK